MTMMRSMQARSLTLAAILAVSLGSAASADDKTACADGIAAIKAEIAKRSPDAVPSKATKGLRVAEREQGEGEFDECLDGLEDAKRALSK